MKRTPSLVSLAVAAMLFVFSVAAPAPFSASEDAPPAGWLAAPMGWMVDHSPLLSDNVNFKMGRSNAEGFLTEWRYRPEDATLEVRFSPVKAGCPGNSIWTMTTRVDLPFSRTALDQDAFSSAGYERTRQLAATRSVNSGESITRGPAEWTYRGSAAPSVTPIRQVDGSWVLVRAYDGTVATASAAAEECPTPYR